MDLPRGRRLPEACYWGLQTWNYLMQSKNYVVFPVCINAARTAIALSVLRDNSRLFIVIQ